MVSRLVALFLVAQSLFYVTIRVSGEYIHLMCQEDINSRSGHLVNFLFNNQRS